MLVGAWYGGDFSESDDFVDSEDINAVGFIGQSEDDGLSVCGYILVMNFKDFFAHGQVSLSEVSAEIPGNFTGILAIETAKVSPYCWAMIRLIACDMDGTLMTSARVPHPENVAAIRKIVDAGIYFCLASGRGIQTIYPTAKMMGLSGPIISSNGGYVVGLNGEEVHHYHLSMEAKRVIVEFALEHDLHLNGYFKNEIAFSSGGRFAELYVSRTGCEAEICHPREMLDRDATKLLYVAEPEVLVELRPGIAERLSELGISVVISEPDYLEFLPPGINKGAGLEKLCEYLGIDRMEVAAIGDWLNDKEMLEWSGTSAAVENGHSEIRAIADHVIPSNDEGGVAIFLEFVLNGT